MATIYAIIPAGPLTYEWRGCADPDNHQTDSENPEFVCPFDVALQYGYAADGKGKMESDQQYADRVKFEFLAMLELRAPVTEKPIPAALSALTAELSAAVDLAVARREDVIEEESVDLTPA